MNRRKFLKTIISSAASYPVLVTASPLTSKVSNRQVELLDTPVAGFQFHDGEKIWHSLNAGSEVALKREPSSPHDHRAVLCQWNGCDLGYIPARENHVISHLMDAGKELTATISQKTKSDNPWGRLRVSVALKEQGNNVL